MDKQPQNVGGVERAFAGFPFFKGFNGQAMRLAVWPIELWLQWQADMLKAAAPATAHWIARRREGTEAALHALERLIACEDVEDASKIQGEWIEGETKRLESDVRALSGQALLWSRETGKAARHAGQTAREPAAERASR